MEKRPAKDEIITACYIRQTFNLGCRNCKFIGEKCEYLKKVLKVDKPFEYRNNNIDVE